MHSLFAPILAQILTVGAGARTEARDVIELGVQHLEGSASAGLGLSLELPVLTLAVGYSPFVTVSPLESSPREVTVSDSGSASVATGYTFRFRRSSLTLGLTASYLVQNPVLNALQGPPPAAPELPPLGGTDGEAPGAPEPPDASDAANVRRGQDFRMQTWTAGASSGYRQSLSRVSTFSADAAYTMTAGLGRSRESNPLVQGPNARLGVEYAATRRDDLTTSLNGQYSWSETGNHGQVVLLGEVWGHDFDRRTHSELGAGVSYSREWTGDGPVLNSIYPAGLASLGHTTRLARGTLTLGVSVASAPVLDVTTATVDPRLGAGASVIWSRRRLTLSAALSSAISLSPEEDNTGALNSLNGSVTAAYDLGSGFTLDGGVRSAWQRFEGATVVNPQSAIFVGLSWGASATVIDASH